MVGPVAIVVRHVVQALVDQPDLVEVKEVSGQVSTVIEVRVGPNEMGKVIGKRGRTADAIRVLLDSFSGKHQRRYTLELVDNIQGGTPVPAQAPVYS